MTNIDLSTALDELGLTRAALAHLCRVEVETVYRWLRDPDAKGTIPVPGYVETIIQQERAIRTLTLRR